MMVTHARLKELFNYNPTTGVFTRIKSVRGKGGKVGTIVGCTHSGYVKIKVDQSTYAAHRLAWLYTYGSLPSDTIDYINGDGTDNRICNLRDVSITENNRNKARSVANTSGCTGVSYSKKDDKWHVRISFDGVRISLGMHKNIKDAIKARKDAEIELGYHNNHDRER